MEGGANTFDLYLPANQDKEKYGLVVYLHAVPGLELVYDSGNVILEDGDPVEYVKKFEEKIGFVHFKDVKKADHQDGNTDTMRDGTLVEAAPTGTGLIDLAGVAEAVGEMGYQDGITVEFVKDPDKTYLQSLTAGREYVENLLQSDIKTKKKQKEGGDA